MKTHLIVTFAVFALLATGCRTAYDSQADRDPRVNLRDFSTYRVEVKEPQARSGRANLLDTDLNRQRIASALHAHMQNRGFTEKGENPDLVVRFSVEERERQETQMMNPNPWWGWGWGANNFVRQYDEATLIVEVINARTRKMAWQGWVRTESRRIQRNLDQRIPEMVSEAFKRFPVPTQRRNADPMAAR